MELQIRSLNVRGIGNKQQRSEIFRWLKAKRFCKYLLQEVHCAKENTAIWSAEWGYKTLFSCCSSSKDGVPILFNHNNFSFQILRLYSDVDGRFIICDIESEGKIITLATLYAPNEDNSTFFQNFFKHLHDFHYDDVIIGNIFNLILNVNKDKKDSRDRTHSKSMKLL